MNEKSEHRAKLQKLLNQSAKDFRRIKELTEELKALKKANKELQAVINKAKKETVKLTATMPVKFLYCDKTGRGFGGVGCILDKSEILRLENDDDWNGIKLHWWSRHAERNDVWENATARITCLGQQDVKINLC